MMFLKHEGDPLFHNAEIAPNCNSDESQISVLTVSPGGYMCHCNKYLRLPVEESDDLIIPNSECRMNVFESFGDPCCKHNLIQMLGDQSHKEHHVFQDCYVKTIAVGKKYTNIIIYSHNTFYLKLCFS